MKSTEGIQSNEEKLLHYCEQGKFDDARTFLAQLPNSKDFDYKYKDPATYAVEHNNITMVAFLREQGIDKEAKDLEGNTALNLACQKDNLKIANFLVNDAKADVNTQNRQGVSPLYYAGKNGNNEIFKLLLTKNPNLARLPNREDFDYHYKDPATGKSYLHYAAEHSNIKTISFFLKQGIHQDAKDNEGNTALHLACQNGKLDTVDFLIKMLRLVSILKIIKAYLLCIMQLRIVIKQYLIRYLKMERI
jgi:ankyrin repeat protein